MAYEYNWGAKDQYKVVGTTTDSEGNVHDILEPQYAPTTSAQLGAWFVCPVTAQWLPKSKGTTIGGVYYSQEAARDIMRERRKERGL